MHLPRIISCLIIGNKIKCIPETKLSQGVKGMNDKVNEFIQYIDELGVSVNTKEAYERDIRQLLRELEAEGIRELSEINPAELMQYIDGMNKKGRSTATISRTIASVRRFFEFTQKKGYTFSDPSEWLKAPKVIRKTPSVLSDKDMKRLISSIDTGSAKGMRDKALLELIMSTGIGVSELIELRKECINLEAQVITINGKQRKLSLGKRVTDTLRNYSAARDELLNGNADKGVYFVSCAGEKMSRQGLWKIIRLCGNNAGIANITPQMLRHSSAVSAMRHGKDANAVQHMLGHSTKTGVLEYKNLAAVE